MTISQMQFPHSISDEYLKILMKIFQIQEDSYLEKLHIV